MKKDFEKIKEFASAEVYTQSTMMTPISIMGAARSLINAKKLTNLAYKGFLFQFKKDYGSIFYQVSDLNKLGAEIWRRLKKDKKYFEKVRKLHRKEQLSSQKFYEEINQTDLSKVSDKKISEYLERALQAIQNGVGAGHIIEGFALTSDDDLKSELLKYTKDKKINNNVYSELTAPEEKSFLRQADESLEKITKAGEKNNNLVEEFKKKYCWIRTSYAGKEEVDDRYVIEESKAKRNLPEWSITRIKNNKKALVKKYKIAQDLLWKINLVAYVGAWQDERKKYIMMGAYYLFRVLDEFSKRSKINTKYLKYLVPPEISKVNDMENNLKDRYEHSFYVADYENFYAVSGNEAKEIEALMKKEHKDTKTLNGMVASSGKAIGKAKICTDFESLKKVKDGDILVTSMTRPEYINAMKKASAFVTDEGGITSHAAIVAREMKKPCIIGTKIATKIIKDGDIVEVDANHGAVKIIKTKK